MTDLDVAIVGAGPAGLSAADALHRAGRSVQVFEAAARVGGRMATRRQDGYVIDEGAEMISTRGYPATWRLIGRYGMDPATEVPRIRAGFAVWRDGRAYPGLGDPLSLAAGGLSVRGRLALLRLLADLGRAHAADRTDHPERGPHHTATVAALAGTYGQELVDRLLQPVVSGFFGWHPARAAATPFLVNLAAAGPPRCWRTYADGMDTLARRIAGTLPVRRDTAIREVTVRAGHARLTTDTETLTARTVVLAVPAPVALALHPGMPDDERPYARSCRYAPVLRLSLLLDAPLRLPLRRAAHLLAIPATQSCTLAGITADHVKHPGRAPAGRGLMSLLAAPDLLPALLDARDAEVTALLLGAAAPIVPALAGRIRSTVVIRHRHGLPEPSPETLALRAAFLARPARPIEYAGDWVALRPSSEGAVRSGELAAARITPGARLFQPEVPVP